ncbi:hypothetical protein [Ancylobacter dichloromethanicus]|uniref:Cellulose synthase n=1 Tax=Ancylobacter dichloromethanicus TaxID=518825 RepID=A0A9W6JCY2_9HYPH|nr:hypothetical protein [Ancylobacter dichloromethanicus]GLK74121.1 hypothetical protein GCM10017643_42390 [Ancylobacter dichloromethanicus]
MLVLVGAVTVPAIGQQFTSPPTPAATATAPDSAAAPKVDESALRFFASQGDSRRLDAEIARLRALYPNWQPPKDLFSPTPDQDPDLARLWQLFSEGKFSDMRAAIAQRQATEPDWTPPAELMTRLDEGEAARRLVNASEARQWASVLRIATDAPGMLVCGNMEVLWRVAEAFVRTDAPKRALDVYTYILNTCTNPEERLATAQKAMQLLDGPDLDTLLALERTNPDGTREFAGLRDDLLRTRVGRAAQDASATVTAEDLAGLETLARGGTAADDALVLGWYAFRHGDAARAVDWFKLALDRDGGAKAAEGYVLALAATRRALQAEPIAYQWRESGADNRKAYIDIMAGLLSTSPPPRLDQSVVARFAPVVSEDKSAAGAQALGWYAYNTGQIGTAASWFGTAAQWAPDDEPAAYGLALAAARLKDKATLDAVVGRWGTRSDRILALVSPEARRRLASRPASVAVPPSAPATPPSRPQLPVQLNTPVSEPGYPAPLAAATSPEPGAGRASPSSGGRGPGQCAGSTEAAFRSGRISGEDAVARGWCLLDLDRPMEAVDAFDLAFRISTGRVAEDAAYGKSLAYLRLGLTNQAQVAAVETSQPSARAVELSADLLSQQAVAAYRDARYVEAILALDERSRIAPEQQDLMMIRAWSYFNLRDFPSARRLFEALQAAGYTEAGAGIDAIMATTRKWRS